MSKENQERVAGKMATVSTGSNLAEGKEINRLFSRMELTALTTLTIQFKEYTRIQSDKSDYNPVLTN